MSEMRECAEFACPGFWPKAGAEACGLRRSAGCVHWRVEAQAAAELALGVAPKTPREIVAELGLPHREPVVDYYVMVAHPFDDGALEPLRAAGYKLTPSGARHTVVGPVQDPASPETTDEAVIDDFVVERIRAGHLDVFEAQEAFGTERLTRLEREDRIVAMGDPYDAYYDVPAADR